MDPEQLARAVKDLVDWAEQHAPEPESPLVSRLREHVGVEPDSLPVVSSPLAPWDRPNFQLAIDEWTAEGDVELIGLPVMQGYRAGLAEVLRGGGPSAPRFKREVSSMSPSRSARAKRSPASGLACG